MTEIIIADPHCLRTSNEPLAEKQTLAEIFRVSNVTVRHVLKRYWQRIRYIDAKPERIYSVFDFARCLKRALAHRAEHNARYEALQPKIIAPTDERDVAGRVAKPSQPALMRLPARRGKGALAAPSVEVYVRRRARGLP